MEPNNLSFVNDLAKSPGENSGKSSAKRKWLGMTLVEVLVASAVFSISFGGLLVAQQMGRTRTEHALINFVSLHYAQGLLEAMQSYPYEDLDDYTTAGNAFNAHPASIGAYQGAMNQSGVYADDNTTWAGPVLPEASLGLRYYRTTLPASPTALDPFTHPFPTLSTSDTLMGPEISDVHVLADVPNGLYRIAETQRALNVFASVQEDGSVGGQERFFFFDDVDDFDGYREVRSILSGIDVTFVVSVAAIYGIATDFSFDFINAGGVTITDSITQQPFHPMIPISISNLQAEVPSLLTALNPTASTQAVGYQYYQSAIFKKITVKATWEYPINSGNLHTIVIDGGVVNPNATQV